jgi:hypothetical protein
MRWIWIERVHIEIVLALGIFKMEFGLVMHVCVIDMVRRSCVAYLVIK